MLRLVTVKGQGLAVMVSLDDLYSLLLLLLLFFYSSPVHLLTAL